MTMDSRCLVAREQMKNNSRFRSAFDDHTLIYLESLYLQLTKGPCMEPFPHQLSLEAKQLWKSWMQLQNMTSLEAQDLYLSQILQVSQFSQDPMLVNFAEEILKSSPNAEPKKSVVPQTGEVPKSSQALGGVKGTLVSIAEEISTLGINSKEGKSHIKMAEEGFRSMAEKVIEAHRELETLEYNLKVLQAEMKQIASDTTVAVDRNDWSFEQIQSQCDELIDRCDTCTNTYHNQITLPSYGSYDKLFSFALSVLLPVGGCISFLWYLGQKGK